MPALALTSKRPVVANIWAFTFKPDHPLSWVAGQFIRVELPHQYPDAEGTKRQFTIASAPADGQVEIATRITGSSFKQALHALPIGGSINLVDLPAGDFVWPLDQSRPIVFAAQGIGITPVRSMLRQRLHDGKPIAATLVYSNLTPGIPYREELMEWAGHAEFKTNMVDTPITARLLAETVPEIAQAHLFVSGPEPLFELMGPPYNLPGRYLKQDQFPNYAVSEY